MLKKETEWENSYYKFQYVWLFGLYVYVFLSYMFDFLSVVVVAVAFVVDWLKITNPNPIKKWHFYDISFTFHLFELEQPPHTYSQCEIEQNGNEVHKHQSPSVLTTLFWTVLVGSALKWSIVCWFFSPLVFDQSQSHLCKETVLSVFGQNVFYYCLSSSSLECADRDKQEESSMVFDPVFKYFSITIIANESMPFRCGCECVRQ